MKKITSIENKIKIGTTNPFKVYCDSGLKLFVMKCRNEGSNGKSLFNELVGYRVAKALSLPTPDFEIARLSQELIDRTPALMSIKAEPGECFISEWIDGITGGLPAHMRSASNKEDFPGILFLDQLLMNVDRGGNRGNWLLEKKTKNITLIDFGYIFRIAQIWDKISLNQDMITPPVLIKELDEELYQNLVSQITGDYPFSKIERSVKNLTDETKQSFLEGIPSSWNISCDDLLAAKEFLYFQFDHYQDIINSLSKKFKL
ncbi:hypothetical protein FC65_GL000848 [Ligilactobacillus acidipiscis DSM 15836]|uniref:HipA-like kinase domain-containing protein n=1 Tax=Ligilactobacillus acidipiscis DSM 15836 TaxID=1423716 RepID=A0ABR5PNF3_9LACO|nr:HipA family kinase [Ligilactobacillus acidipiscis]KRM31938.1 hypothetical protein FC65_GL000848 [Ligilactobacillus acidipiscis DSM 15836]GAW63057.1 hypothetical protein Lacidipiscis_00239 [Ligilactobacillus acidipiscis]GEN19651.1 hypothetical protein LAC02_29320 [Ligilactobacillus acidipiscis]